MSLLPQVVIHPMAPVLPTLSTSGASASASVAYLFQYSMVSIETSSVSTAVCGPCLNKPGYTGARRNNGHCLPLLKWSGQLVTSGRDFGAQTRGIMRIAQATDNSDQKLGRCNRRKQVISKRVLLPTNGVALHADTKRTCG
jgi:hypothetical protein